MTSNPVGAANRSDLFGLGPPPGSPAAALFDTSSKQPCSTPSSSSVRMASPIQSSNPISISESPLNYENKGSTEENVEIIELEHIIGFSGHGKNTIHFHPQQDDTFITCMGSTVVIGRIDDPHQQEILRAHDEEINGLIISKSGALIASCQFPSKHGINGVYPSILVWETSSQKPLYLLNGFTCEILAMAFSPDDHFLVASGTDCRLLIWDMRTSELILGQSFPSMVTIVEWGKMKEKSRRPKYTLLYAYSSQLIVTELAYDIASMQYKLQTFPCQMPSTGLVREYQCCCLSNQQSMCLAGTKAGELILFRVEAQVYHGTLPLSSNGIHSLITCDLTDAIYVGAGDGMVHKLLPSSPGESATSASISYAIAASIRVDGIVHSLSLRSDGQALLIGTSSGTCYTLDIETFHLITLSQSHVNAIVACTYDYSNLKPQTTSNERFATIGQDGTVRIWDLSTYFIIAQTSEACSGSCLAFSSNELLLTGWKDGGIRGYDSMRLNKQWEISNAHKSAITSITSGDKFIVSGSMDGGVNVWSLFTRELVLTFHEHKKAVTTVLVDIQTSNYIHSCGLDRAVFTYDLKKEKRIVAHQVREGGFQCMTQRKDHELELVTGGCDGRIHVWDCDIVDSVLQLTDPSRLRINQVSISPSGHFLITCADDFQVKLYDMEKEILLACVLGHSNVVQSVAWSPDERQIISVGNDCCICVWNFYG